MKKIRLFIMMLCLGGGVAMAQKPVMKEMMTPELRAQKMTEQMKKELSLTDQQAKEVQTLNLQMVSQMKERRGGMEKKELCDSCKKIIKERKADKQKLRGEFREMKEMRNEQLKKILTQDQYELYLKNMKERTAKAQKTYSRK